MRTSESGTLVERREAEDAAKLQVLRQAARVGLDALGRDEFKEFDSIEELEAYLSNRSDKVISGAADARPIRVKTTADSGTTLRLDRAKAADRDCHARRPHHLPVFGIDAHGSFGGSGAPFCKSSIECLSGERTNAITPSRGGRLMVTPAFISFSHSA